MSFEKNWEEKYRPTSLEEMILSDPQRTLLQEFLIKKTIKNLLLTGHQGIGKTTLAKVLVKTLDASCLYINCGMENGVDIVRSRIQDFCAMSNLKEVPKIVILDESDALTGNTTGGSSAQSALRNLIETSSDDTRFILTCNYINKIIPPIRSRCLTLDLQKFTKQDVLKYCIQILKKENIKSTKESLQDFSQEVIHTKFPDIRNIINNLEAWSITKTLTNPGINISTEIDQLVQQILTLQDPKQIRKLYINKEDIFARNYEMLAGEIFNKIEDQTKMILISESIYKMGLVLDKEIQFFSMILQLK